MRFRTKAELTKWALNTKPLWLFLDYDGTLADFAPTPDHIEPSSEIIRLVEELAHKPGIRVTVLSGRRLDHVCQLLPVSGIILAGTYGIELLDEAGKTIHRVDYNHIRPVLEMIKPHWEQQIAGRKGYYLEDKDWALALHARLANEMEAEQLLAQALADARRQIDPDRFRILGGHKFLEVAPRLASKRETIVYLLHRYPLPRAGLLLFGDDDKDEEAFPVIQAHQGVAVKVRQPSQAEQLTTADFFFESTGETRTWLEELL